MFKAIVEVAYGTGAGYGFEPHRYAGATGVGFSKSPKRALQLAERDANRKCGMLGCAIPIHRGGVLLKGTQVVGVVDEGLWHSEAK